MSNPGHEQFMREAIRLSLEGMRNGCGGPFGAVVVKDGEIIGAGYNQVVLHNDPTAHAEVIAIRNAAKEIQSFNLAGSVIYASCKPCPMCMSAIMWARIDEVYYANATEAAAKIGFDDGKIYDALTSENDQEIVKSSQLLMDEAVEAFKEWESLEEKISY